MSETLAKYRDDVLRQARDVSKDFNEPDDDWGSVLLLESAGGNRSLVIVDMDQDMKNNLPAVIVQVFRELVPLRAALVLSTFQLEIPAPDTPMGQLALEMIRAYSLENNPEAMEYLTAMIAEPGEDEVWRAPIFRKTSLPPVLGEWDSVEVKMTHGRFAGILQKAFAATSKLRERKKGKK